MRWLTFDPKLQNALCCWDQEFWDREFANTPPNVVGIAARYHLDCVEAIREALSELRSPVLLLTSDEDSTFPWHQLVNDARVWVQSPRVDVHTSPELRFLPVGFSTRDWEAVRDLPPDRNQPDSWTFGGQVTHARRQECWDALSNLEGQHGLPGYSRVTDSFISPAGWPREEYLLHLAYAKTAPAPSGPVSADTFRCWEALEAGAVPIVDDGPLHVDYQPGFWHLLLGEEPPFPILPHWEGVAGHIRNIEARFPAMNNTVFAWWQRYKKRLRTQVAEDAGGPWSSSGVTVVIPVSPIPEHPSTETLEAVYESVRKELPSAPVILTFDGPSPETEHRRADYEEFIRRALWLTNYKWTNTTPMLFRSHLHQAQMLRLALSEIDTPLLLYVEHDTPVGGVEPIPWDELGQLILSGEVNLVRLHHEASILKDHRYLMLDRHPQTFGNLQVPFMRTIQWSQRPHLASTDFYRWLLDTYFSPNDRTFIEDRMHGIVQDAHARYGETGWRQFRLAIYTPPGDMKRSWHLDGRAGDPKTGIYQVSSSS